MKTFDSAQPNLDKLITICDILSFNLFPTFTSEVKQLCYLYMYVFQASSDASFSYEDLGFFFFFFFFFSLSFFQKHTQNQKVLKMNKKSLNGHFGSVPKDNNNLW